MLKEEDKKNTPISKTIPASWTIDQSFPNDWVFLNRVLRLAHSSMPEKYAAATLNYLNFSTLTSDLPLSPLFEFDPRDYHRFRFKTENTLLKQLSDCVKGQYTWIDNSLIFVNDIAHAGNILWTDSIKCHHSFPSIEVGGSDATKTLELRTRLVHQGEVPNLSKLFKFWTQHEHFSKTLARFNIDLHELKKFTLHSNHKIKRVSALLRNKVFVRFLSLGNTDVNYLSIFTDAVYNMLSGLQDKNNLSETEKDSLAIILSYCEKATISHKDPLEFTKCIQLIFEEIKMLLSDSNYSLQDFEKKFERIIPFGKFYYANSGSNALSIILHALRSQKKEKLHIVNIGCKYYEETLSLKNSEHKQITLDDDITSIDVLRMDLKSPANCQREYMNQDIYSILDIIKKRGINSHFFSLIIDGTLNSFSDTAVEKLSEYFKKIFPHGNFVYFGSGVKSHCLGVDVATFGWISVNNSSPNFSEFNDYLQRQSQRNANDNHDFQYVTHLVRCCSTQLKLYHQQLLDNTRRIHSAIRHSVDTVCYEGNEVPYIEIFSDKPLETLQTQLADSLLRYRGSFGFPYPTWLNITNNTERSSIRVSCGLLSEELNQSLIELLGSTFAKQPLPQRAKL